MYYAQNADLLSDYSAVTNPLERKAVEAIFRILMNRRPLQLDFDSTTSVKFGKEKARFGIAPPRLLPLLMMLINPRYLACEYYTRGYWYCTFGDISDVVLAWQNNFDAWSAKIRLFFELQTRIRFLYKQCIRPIKSTRDAKKHYNISYKFFKNIIGETMVYSCAFFKEGDDLETAQIRKLDQTIVRLFVGQDTLNILDIGCGWGSFGFYAIKNTRTRVDGITIAKNQVEYANLERERLPEEDRSRLSFLHADYRGFRKNEKSVYDRIVSIGMLEHVGLRGYPEFFACISRLLKPGGLAVIHSLTCIKGGATNMWVDKHIFPGGYIPRVSEVILGSEKADLFCDAIFRYDGRHYVETLKRWRNNLIFNYDKCMDELRKMTPQRSLEKGATIGRDDADKYARKLMRIWSFYFSALQSMFLRNINQCSICQFVFKKI